MVISIVKNDRLPRMRLINLSGRELVETETPGLGGIELISSSKSYAPESSEPRAEKTTSRRRSASKPGPPLTTCLRRLSRQSVRKTRHSPGLPHQDAAPLRRLFDSGDEVRNAVFAKDLWCDTRAVDHHWQ